jgi:Cd2+/Zn2+-exporting ATPase
MGVSALAIGLGAVLMASGHTRLGLAACAVALVLSVPDPARRALRSIRKRSLDINVLMIIAVAGAVALGDYVEAAAVVWLFEVAEWLEVRSLERAGHAIRALMTLAPAMALVRRRGAEVLVPAGEVEVGEMVVIRPGERVPLDGVVRHGESSLNQAPVTGESWPVDKQPGDAVFAGTINGTGALDIVTTRPASDSTISRIVHSVQEAQRRRAPVQMFVDRFARAYTPAVTLLAVIVAVVPPMIFGGGDWGHAFGVWSYRALALLVVACPCALVISTPVSMVSALTAAAREGVLIKGGAHLEQLGRIRCVAFDKTGTLTHGRVTVTDVLGVKGISTDGVLSVAAALELRSEHPIGRAIVHEARSAGLSVAPGEDFRALPGRGAEATVDEAVAVVGSHRLFEERQLCTPDLHDRLEQVTERGATPVLVGHRGAALGVIGLTDAMRSEGRQAIAALRAEGVTHVALLTGDTAANARIVAEGTGLDEVHAELLPDDKVRRIGALREKYGPVVMVGDGINDAPALAAADVGVAMGAAGSDVALETADVALMSDELAKLPYALRLGRAARRNIRTNVGLALGLKLAFVALAAMGLATLWMAILADTGASLLVTANGLRLLRVK